MSMFSVTRKIIEFTPNMERAKHFPPEPVKFNLPDWYKAMDNSINGLKDSADTRSKTNGAAPFTIKRCVPVSDYLTTGYVIKSFTEVMLSQDVNTDPCKFKWSIPNGEYPNYVFGTHPHSQCPIKFDEKDKHYLKFFSGWRIKTPPGYSCMFYQNFYLQEKRFTLFPSIVDTDTYDGTIAFPGYINGNISDIKISAGTPLVTVFPFKRDDWKIVINENVIHDDMTNSGIKMRQYFENVYRNFFHSKKKFD